MKYLNSDIALMLCLKVSGESEKKKNIKKKSENIEQEHEQAIPLVPMKHTVILQTVSQIQADTVGTLVVW